MAYLLPADFRTETQIPATQGCTVDESWGDTYLTATILQIQEGIENELGDTFEPPTPDNDLTLELNSWGTPRLYVPRRIRSITTVKTRDQNGTLTTQTSSTYRVTSSTSGADLSDNDLDYIDVVPGQVLSVGSVWPYGSQTVQLIGKFGWASTPADIKRLTALLVYDYLKPVDGRLRKTEELRTEQGTFSFVPVEPGETGIREADAIIRRYRRNEVLVR